MENGTDRDDKTRKTKYLSLVTAALAGALVVTGGQFVADRNLRPAPPSDMTEVIRKALMDHPEWIPEAINRMQENEVRKLLASNREAIEKPFHGAWAGNPEGSVTLVEFFDYNCPFCERSAADVERLLAEDDDLKVVYRDLPVLGPESERFALASLSAARQNRYQRFYDAVFSGEGGLDQQRLIASVREAGLSEGDVASALQSAELKAEVEKNLNLARALGINGTPSWVVGDEILSGAVGYEALKEAVAKARSNG